MCWRRIGCAAVVLLTVGALCPLRVTAAEQRPTAPDYVIDHVTTKKPVIFITVDDGSYLSPETVQYIRRKRIPITTFALPQLLNFKRDRFISLMRKTGMTFENHSQTHRSVTRMDYRAQRAEICAGRREVNRVIRRMPMYFRPPGGSWNDDTVKAAQACRVARIVLWNVVADQGRIIRKDGGSGLRRGDIILMHYLDSLSSSLAIVLREAEKRGLRPVLLRDHLDPPPPAE